MLALALQAPMHPRVGYIGGVCEAIPLADGAMDAALLFGVWHHLRDRVAGAAELARVIRQGGTLLVRTSPSDRVARPWWDDWLPEVYETDRRLLPTLAQTVATITAAEFDLVAVDDVVLPAVLTRQEDFAQLQHRSLSTFEHLDDRVVDEGIQRIAAALAIDPDSDRPAHTAPQVLLSFRRR